MIVVSCCLFVTSINAQQSKNIEGRVFSEDGDVAGTHVLNITTKKATITGANGFFTIAAKLNDTLIFSAVQYRRKLLPVNLKVLESNFLNIYMEEGEIKLDEVFVTPYNLTGDLSKDLDSLNIGSMVTASSLGLPNADIIPLTPSERKLYTARTWDAHFYVIAAGTKLDPLINYFSGRTKMLNERVVREEKYKLIEKMRNFFADSLYVQSLNIPESRIMDFIFFCETDSVFQSAVNSHDRLKIWEYMRKESLVYRKNNNLD